jgi:excisionase family DNA binding protein
MHPVKTITTRLFINTEEAAAILGVDPRTLRRAVERGEVPATRLGVRILIPTAWLRSQAARDGGGEPPAA